MNIKLHPIFVLWLSFILPATAVSQTDYTSPENLIRFADYLFDEDDYLRAAGEYQRYLLTTENPASRDSIYYKIILCYRLDNNFNKAIKSAGSFLNNYPNSLLHDAAAYQLALSYYQNRDYVHSLETLNNLQSRRGDILSRSSKLKIVNYLHLGEWESALHLSTGGIELPGKDTIPEDRHLHDLVLEASKLPYKSQWKAGALSAVLPGSGKVYTGNNTDAAVSALLIGILAWQSWRGFDKDGVSSTSGWVNGFIGGGVYLSGIYGAAVSVKRYNNRLEMRIFGRADRFINAKYR